MALVLVEQQPPCASQPEGTFPTCLFCLRGRDHHNTLPVRRSSNETLPFFPGTNTCIPCKNFIRVRYAQLSREQLRQHLRDPASFKLYLHGLNTWEQQYEKARVRISRGSCRPLTRPCSRSRSRSRGRSQSQPRSQPTPVLPSGPASAQAIGCNSVVVGACVM